MELVPRPRGDNRFGPATAGYSRLRWEAQAIRKADEGEKLFAASFRGRTAPEEVLVRAPQSGALSEAKLPEGTIATVGTQH